MATQIIPGPFVASSLLAMAGQRQLLENLSGGNRDRCLLTSLCLFSSGWMALHFLRGQQDKANEVLNMARWEALEYLGGPTAESVSSYDSRTMILLDGWLVVENTPGRLVEQFGALMTTDRVDVKIADIRPSPTTLSALEQTVGLTDGIKAERAFQAGKDFLIHPPGPEILPPQTSIVLLRMLGCFRQGMKAFMDMNGSG